MFGVAAPGLNQTDVMDAIETTPDPELSDMGPVATVAQQPIEVRDSPAPAPVHATLVEAKIIGSVDPPRDSPELLELKNRLRIRSWICLFLMLALGFSIYKCFSLIFYYLEHGHQLGESFVKWLCAVTIAQIAVMLSVFVRSVWGRSSGGRGKH